MALKYTSTRDERATRILVRLPHIPHLILDF
jgi:hypothetical protein